MSIKPDWDARIVKGMKELNKEPTDKTTVKSLLCDCLKEKGISGDVFTINPLIKVDYAQISKDYKTNGEGHIIFVQFANTGHIAVVGLGKDIGFPKNENSGTWRILSRLGVDWDTSEVIVIPIRDLDKNSKGFKNVQNILRCRQGVEQCIGDYLIEKGVPILNFYQHKNYSDIFWKHCENNQYMIK